MGLSDDLRAGLFALLCEAHRHRQVIAIDNGIHHPCQSKGSQDIKHGVLFDEQCGKDDGNGKQKGADSDSLFLPKLLIMHNGKMGTQGIVNVDARPKIGWSVSAPQVADHPGKQIVPWHLDQTEVMPIGPQGGDNQKNGHSRKKEDTGLVIIAFICEKQIQYHNGYICKPQKIRNDKQLTKGYVIIDIHMDYMIMLCDGVLQMPEPEPVYGAIANQGKGMTVFTKNFFECFHDISFAIEWIRQVTV